MALYVLPNGIIGTNTYILSDDRECVVIDCGVKTPEIMNTVKAHDLHVKYILLTHGHFDHIFHVKSLKEATGAQLCLHQDELEVYQSPYLNGSRLFDLRRDVQTVTPDILLKDGDILQVGALRLEIIHTPGHSPGSICILSDDMLFSGDTLFAMSVGRTDFPGGSAKALKESISRRLFTLDGNIAVYPGHGPKTTIGYEKENNPYA